MDLIDSGTTERTAHRVAGDSRAPARRFEHQTGYVLHTYPYSESSLIVESFTRTHGRVPLLAKGAKRRGSAMRGVLRQFQPVELSWSGKGDLRNLTRAEWQGGVPGLRDTALFCGFYLNELLLKLLARDDPHERLFDQYEIAVRALAEGPERGGSAAHVLRRFEKELLGEIGYALNLDAEADSSLPIDPTARYTYDPERGPRPLSEHESCEIELSGRTLMAIRSGDYADPMAASQAKQLMRFLLRHHLNGKTLSTRTIFSALQQL